MDSLTDGNLVMVATLTPFAAEAVSGGAIDLHLVVVTNVWLAQG